MKSGYRYAKVMGKLRGMHRFVCRAFLGAPPTAAHTQVDHIDGDPSNNRRENVRWVTPSQNVRHSYATNLARASSAGRRSKPVLGRKRPRASAGTAEEASDGEEAWVSYASANAAARALDLKPGNIRACCHGKCQQTGGYEFRFDAE